MADFRITDNTTRDAIWCYREAECLRCKTMIWVAAGAKPKCKKCDRTVEQEKEAECNT